MLAGLRAIPSKKGNSLRLDRTDGRIVKRGVGSEKPGNGRSDSLLSWHAVEADLFHPSFTDGLQAELAEVLAYCEWDQIRKGLELSRRMADRSVPELLFDMTRTKDGLDSMLASADYIVYLLCGQNHQGPSDLRLKMKHVTGELKQSPSLELLCEALIQRAIRIIHLHTSNQSSTIVVVGTKERMLFQQLLNITCILFISEQEDVEFVRRIEGYRLEGRSLLQTCFDLILLSGEGFSVKKVLIIIRWMLLLTLPLPVGSKQRPLREDGSVDPVKMTMHKSSMGDLKRCCDHINKCFGPIHFLDDEEGYQLCLSEGVPKALRDRVATIQEHLHLSYWDHDIIIKRRRREVEAIHPNTAASKEKSETESYAQQYYRALVPSLRQYMVALLKHLLSTAPNVRPTMRPTKVHEELDDSEGIEYSRHCEIVLKSVSFIILHLLRSWRNNHPLQSAYLQCILQDKNALIVILKYLNQDIAASCLKTNEVRSLSLFGVENLDNVKQVSEIVQKSSPLEAPSWRKYFGYCNLLRILQKITKHSPRRIKTLVSLNAQIILKRPLKVLQSDMRYYSLKILKSMIPYLDAKWRYDNMNIISKICLHIRMGLEENWMTSAPVDNAENEIELHKSIRRLVHRYNEQFVRPAHQTTPAFICSNPDASDEEIIRVALAEFPEELSIRTLAIERKKTSH